MERVQQVGRIALVLALSGALAACSDGHHNKKKSTPTPTAIATATRTATAIASATVTPPDTATATRTGTAPPTATATASRSATPSATASPPATSTATPDEATATATATVRDTATATATATRTRTATGTPAGTATATATGTPAGTATATVTFTPTPTATPGASCEISVTTDLGVICGTTATVAGVESHAFLGIPYGEDTGGANRWAAPVPVTSLPDKFQATHPGPICPQANPPTTVPPPSEDCLFLNVWTPPTPSETARPVMVFIHGGAFLTGSGASPLYDSAYLSTTEDVVVVTLNYRLGALGFLAGIAGLEGNFGFLDQQLALRWVRDNIAAFGGDPEQVTLFGESAGAMSVGLHLLSAPDSKDLFAADLMESNPFALPYKTVAEAAPFGTLLAGLLQCQPTDLECLRAASWEDVVAVQEDKSLVIPGLLSGFGGLLLWTPVVDGTVITEEPVAAAESNGLGKPTLLGTNLNEGTLFVYAALEILQQPTLTPQLYTELITGLFGGTTAAEVLALYPPESDSAPVAAQLTTDYIFFCASRAVAEAGDQQTYAYQFEQVSNFNLFPAVPQCLDQVCHSAELPYVFNSAGNIGETFTPDEQALAEQMVRYWGSFSRPGHDPSPIGAPVAWPPFPGDNYLILNTPISTEVDPPHNCDFWDTVGYGALGVPEPSAGSAE